MTVPCARRAGFRDLRSGLASEVLDPQTRVMPCMAKFVAAFAIVVVSGTSCTIPVPPTPRSEPEPHLWHRYQAVLRRAKRRVDWQNLGPRVVEVPGAGTIIVRDWRLQGLPGREYMRFVFTYDNSTHFDFDRVRVWFSVKNGKGERVATEWMDLQMYGLGFWPGNTYTAQIRVPTHGAHFEPGWSWSASAYANEARDVGSVKPTSGLAGR